MRKAHSIPPNSDVKRRIFKSLKLIIPLICIAYMPAPVLSQVLPKRKVDTTAEGSKKADSAFRSKIKAIVDAGIDPRKYVSVFYKKRPDSQPESSLMIWSWDSSLAQHQKFKVLDKQGVVNIYFDKVSLAREQNFKGNISLSAKVKSSAGERALEVAPYSRIGEARKTFGTEGVSPQLTAQLLFNWVYAMKKTLYKNAFLQVRDDASLFTPVHDIEVAISDIQNTNDQSRTDFPSLNLVLSKYDAASSTNAAKLHSTQRIAPLSTKFVPLLIGLREDIKLRDLEKQRKYITGSHEDIKRLNSSLQMINSYLNAFEQVGVDSKAVFLGLMGQDVINFEHYKKNLITNQKVLQGVIDKWSITATSLDPGLVYIVNDVRTSLTDMSTYTGTQLGNAIKTALSDRYRDIDSLTEPSKSFEVKTVESDFENLELLVKNGKLPSLIEDISQKAGSHLYSLLTYATIDLAKNDVKEGDILYLSVEWKNFRDQMIDSLKNKDSEQMEIGSYRIQKTGWSTEVSESFYLIERINEPNHLLDNRVSPSNFKGAAGISLMRTFNYTEPYNGKKHAFANWLQPSVGLNLSYIDFYTNKDLELGLGAQVGLFKNSIFLGYGLNLNSIRGGDKAPTYFMLGLSFTNLAAKFRTEPNQ